MACPGEARLCGEVVTVDGAPRRVAEPVLPRFHAARRHVQKARRDCCHRPPERAWSQAAMNPASRPRPMIAIIRHVLASGQAFESHPFSVPSTPTQVRASPARRRSPRQPVASAATDLSDDGQGGKSRRAVAAGRGAGASAAGADQCAARVGQDPFRGRCRAAAQGSVAPVSRVESSPSRDTGLLAVRADAC